MRAIVLHDQKPSFGLKSLREAIGPSVWAIAATAEFPDAITFSSNEPAASTEMTIPASPSIDIVAIAEQLMERTNSIDAPWHEQAKTAEGFNLVPRDSLRSTSIGDIILIEVEPGLIKGLICASFGWNELSPAEIEAINLPAIDGSKAPQKQIS